MADFHGEPTRCLENQFVRLEVLENSARIVGLSFRGRSNLFADLGTSSIETPFGKFKLRGGHRLWHAPEAMPRTYMPDDQAASLVPVPGGLRIDMPAEPWTQIAKSIEITLNPDQPHIAVRHELRNEGAWPVEFSVWGVTMFRLGGVAIFPQPIDWADEDGLLPNRHLSLWAYSRISDPRLTWRDDFILARPALDLPPFKFGYFNPHGWMGYWLEDTLFVKRFDRPSGARFPDHGCNTECYFNERCIELESLSPLLRVAPLQSLVHTEIWEMYDRLDVPFLPGEIQKLIASEKVF